MTKAASVSASVFTSDSGSESESASGLDAASIAEATARIEDDIVRLRREIHRHPELAGHEQRTSALVAEQLTTAGLTVTTGVGGHGVVAVVEGAAPGPTIAFRADMDAVDADELFRCDFASTVPGAAHLCGHDVHTAVGVGLARVLAGLRKQINGRVMFLFQPAEEDLTGAEAMLADGVFDRDPPREIYALHCAPLPVGAFAVMPGTGQPGQDSVEITFSGPNAMTDAARLAATIEGFGTVQRPGSPGSPEEYRPRRSSPARRL